MTSNHIGLAQALACSLILSRMDYCNALLHAWCPSRDDPQAAASAEQCGSDCTLSIKATDAKQPLRRLPVEQRIIYNTPVLTFKIRYTATPVYLNRDIQSRDCVQNLRSSGTQLLLARPSRKTDFAARGFRHSAPAVWNSLPKTVLDSSWLTVFKSKLKLTYFTCLTMI